MLVSLEIFVLSTNVVVSNGVVTIHIVLPLLIHVTLTFLVVEI